MRQNSLPYTSLGKNNFGVIFRVFGQTFPYDRFSQVLGYATDCAKFCRNWSLGLDFVSGLILTISVAVNTGLN